jgi:hypothetical protein
MRSSPRGWRWNGAPINLRPPHLEQVCLLAVAPSLPFVTNLTMDKNPIVLTIHAILRLLSGYSSDVTLSTVVAPTQ